MRHHLFSAGQPAASRIEDAFWRQLEEREEGRSAQEADHLFDTSWVGEPLEVLGRVTRWVEPTTAETANVKKLRGLIAELREQGSPALDGIASRIEACITAGERRGYPLIEPPPRQRRAV